MRRHDKDTEGAEPNDAALASFGRARRRYSQVRREHEEEEKKGKQNGAEPDVFILAIEWAAIYTRRDGE